VVAADGSDAEPGEAIALISAIGQTRNVPGGPAFEELDHVVASLIKNMRDTENHRGHHLRADRSQLAEQRWRSRRERRREPLRMATSRPWRVGDSETRIGSAMPRNATSRLRREVGRAAWTAFS
jgi:hypothetical protein